MVPKTAGGSCVVMCLLAGACDPPREEASVRAADVPSASATTNASPSATSSSGGTLAAARELMERFIGPQAETGKLLADLAPRPGDAAAVFTPELAAKAEAHYAKRSPSLSPAEHETELLMWKVTTAELRAGRGDAAKCPAAFRSMAPSLALGATWYCFRFVRPAEKEGTRAEGLTFVRGHWALFAAPWEIE